jgi:hypothetical protein
MPTSPSNQVCNQLELWKLVLKKYFLYVEYYVLRALGGDPYTYMYIYMCTG